MWQRCFQKVSAVKSNKSGLHNGTAFVRFDWENSQALTNSVLRQVTTRKIPGKPAILRRSPEVVASERLTRNALKNRQIQ
jgi:hypothetical protein